jgi:hypothetical protein
LGETTAAARARAIEGFARVLCELREAAGTPSFRTMSGRSHAISHTTLHEAVKGNRLPSWATTVEFVKACGADPADFRERWEQATAALPRASALTLDPDPIAADDEPTVPVNEAVDLVAPPRRRWLWVAAVSLTVVVLAASGATWSLTHDAHAAPRSTPGPTAADCPVRQQNPPPVAPANDGDRAAYVADLTMPDCSHVARGQSLRKVWRFKNAGSVPWRGYSLHRIDLPQQRDQCQTISDVPVADTAPGDLVDISVEVTTPARAGFCFVRFKMVDAQGRVAFPGSRPVNFQVLVD